MARCEFNESETHIYRYTHRKNRKQHYLVSKLTNGIFPHLMIRYHFLHLRYSIPTYTSYFTSRYIVHIFPSCLRSLIYFSARPFTFHCSLYLDLCLFFFTLRKYAYNILQRHKHGFFTHVVNFPYYST